MFFQIRHNKLLENYFESIKSYEDVKLLFDVGTVIVLAIMVLVLIEVIKLPTASLFLLIYLFVMMIPQFSTIQRSYQYFINMLPAYDNVKMLEKQCQENNEIMEVIGNEIELNNVITFKNVSFSYSNKEKFSIEDLNFKISAGKTTAIVGSSGAGKSTIADIGYGDYYNLDNGEIIVDDIHYF